MPETNASASLTHHVRLILDNDEPLYRLRRVIVQDHGDSPATVADRLKDLYEDLCEIEQDNNLARLEILTTAIDWVDWDDLARDYIEEEAELDS